MKLTARTKVTVLDRAHTLLLIVAGVAAGASLLFLVPVPKGQLTLPSLGLLAASLTVGCFTSSATDALLAKVVRPIRSRWLNEAAARPSGIPIDTV